MRYVEGKKGKQAIWRGANGAMYEYDVYSVEARPTTNDKGNYIFAKRAPSNAYWLAVYVGEGKLRDRYDAALDEGCVTKKGATHYHRHFNDSKTDRVSEETEIINGNTECKHPTGCNGKD